MRNKLKYIVKKILPWKLYKLVTNGFCIVPAYYRAAISDLEKYFDLSLENNEGKDVLLARKYAHIVDKGMHSDNVSVGHSGLYYQLLKSKMEKLDSATLVNDPSLIWVKDRINKYETLQTEGAANFPLGTLSELLSNKDDLSCENLVELIKFRRTNRSFKEMLLSSEDVNKMLEVVHWSASSCNKQPIKVFYSLEPSLNSKGMQCCKGATCFSSFVPGFFVFCADSRGYVWPLEYQLPSIDVSLGAQNFFLVGTTLGISGSILTWSQKTKEDEIHLRTLFQIPDHYIIVFCAAMGYAKRISQTPSRKKE